MEPDRMWLSRRQVIQLGLFFFFFICCGEISHGGIGMQSEPTRRWFYDPVLSLLPINIQSYSSPTTFYWDRVWDECIKSHTIRILTKAVGCLQMTGLCADIDQSGYVCGLKEPFLWIGFNFKIEISLIYTFGSQIVTSISNPTSNPNVLILLILAASYLLMKHEPLRQPGES